MCANFTICPKRPAVSDDVVRRGSNSISQAGMPAGASNAVRLGGGAIPTASRMRAYFTVGPSGREPHAI